MLLSCHSWWAHFDENWLGWRTQATPPTGYSLVCHPRSLHRVCRSVDLVFFIVYALCHLSSQGTVSSTSTQCFVTVNYMTMSNRRDVETISVNFRPGLLGVSSRLLPVRYPASTYVLLVVSSWCFILRKWSMCFPRGVSSFVSVPVCGRAPSRHNHDTIDIFLHWRPRFYITFRDVFILYLFIFDFYNKR